MNKKTVLVIGLGALVLLGGAGAGAYFVLPQQGGDGAAGQSQQDYDRYVFVTVEPLSAPVVRHNRVSHFIYLEVALEVPESVDVRAIRKQMPRLRDAFLRDFHRRSILRGDGSRAIDFVGLKARLVEIGNRVLGARVIRDVLIKKAMEAAG